jgi:hypothetical protein
MDISRAFVVGSAAVLGALTAACYAITTGLAFNAHSRAWEMGAIPLLLAALVFVGVLAGIVAGLVARRHPYLAAFLASLLLFAIAVGVNDWREVLTPQMTRDERREFWANIEGQILAKGAAARARDARVGRQDVSCSNVLATGRSAPCRFVSVQRRPRSAWLSFR